jgi:hypothetical protein
MSGPYASGPTQPLERFCPHCGTANAPGMNFCSQCGKPLNEARASAIAPGAYSPQQPAQAQPYYPPSPPAPPQAAPYYPPQPAYAIPPPVAQTPYPAYEQPRGPIATQGRKSLTMGFLLAFLFGPLGLFYSTVLGGIIMILVAAVAVGLFFLLVVNRMDSYVPLATDSGITWITLLALGMWLALELTCIIWAIVAVNSHNSKLQASAVR